MSAHTSTPVTAVKGNLINKSSPLATESCKLEKQFITAQNMASHYKRIINAKPTIDTTPPKSLTKSVKAQDRTKREMLKLSWANRDTERAKSAETPRSITEDNTKSLTTVSKTLKSEESKTRTLPDQKKLNQSMSKMVTNFTKHPTNRVKTYRPVDHNEPSQFVNPMASSHSLTSQEKNAKNMLTTVLFNARASNDPNSSGILNPALKAMSRLVSGHNYDYLDIHADKFKQPKHDFEPRIKDKENSSSKLRESGCYEPPRRHKRDVEKKILNESIHDQVEENLNTSKINKSKVEFTEDEDEDFGYRKHDMLNNSNVLNVSSSSKKMSSRQSSLKRSTEKEEELKYLEFIKDVTEDILQRGLTSNRVITNCFNFHLNKNRNRLDEKKMRELLDSLRDDIGIPNENEPEIGVEYYQTVNRAILLDKERNKENQDDAGTEYLTLRKFGYTSMNTPRSEQQIKKVDLNSSQLSQTTKMFDDYGNQIKRNIQNIRRKSSDSSETEKPSSRKNSVESHKSVPQSTGSILKKSSSQTSEMSRKSSVESKSRESMARKTSQENVRSESTQKQDEEDDGDDLFIGSKFSSQKSSKQGSKQATPNGSRKNSLVKQNFNKEDFEDEGALFNDNYGQKENKMENNSENEDNFDELIKTKAFKRQPLSKKSIESNNSERSVETPTPRPRMTKSFSNESQQNKNANTSDEDF